MLLMKHPSFFLLSRQFVAEQLSLKDVLEYLTKEDLAELGLRSVNVFIFFIFHSCTLLFRSSLVPSSPAQLYTACSGEREEREGGGKGEGREGVEEGRGRGEKKWRREGSGEGRSRREKG